MTKMMAQRPFPVHSGERARYTALIEMPKAYLSGICILLREDEVLKGAVFNEFGVSAVDFSYYPKKDKVKLHHVIKMLNRWYIKRILKKDLRELIHCLQQGDTQYRNEKYKIYYKFTPLEKPTPNPSQREGSCQSEQL